MDQEHLEQQENISIRTKHLQKCKKKRAEIYSKMLQWAEWRDTLNDIPILRKNADNWKKPKHVQRRRKKTCNMARNEQWQKRMDISMS